MSRRIIATYARVVSNPENLELVKKLIDMAMLTKGADGRKTTAEIRMAEQIKKYFDWWDALYVHR